MEQLEKLELVREKYMLQLIKRCPEYTLGYKEYCQELYDNNIIYFRPTNPNSIDEDWFLRTKSWYDKKEKGLIEEQPVSFHYWAVDDSVMRVWHSKDEASENISWPKCCNSAQNCSI